MDKRLNEVIQIRHTLHSHPELSLNEVWTKNYLYEYLKTHTHLEVVDCGKYLYAIYNPKRFDKRIAFRADFDALAINETCSFKYCSKYPGVPISVDTMGILQF